MTIGIPLIDISGLSSPDLVSRKEVADRLGLACRTIGCFYVSCHDISEKMLSDVFAASRAFFALSMDAKQALLHQSRSHYGYIALEAERLDTSAPPDMKETFSIGLELPLPDGRVVAGERRINQWPPVSGWRDLMLSYFQACWDLGLLLHRGFSIDLGLDEDHFDPMLNAPLAALRFLHYPPPDQASEQRTGSGAGEHTDYGNLTILAVDGAAGLELRTRDGDWVKAPNIAGALICNIGDCLMRWTNDTYVSTPHRVTSPQHDRYSVAFFLDPNPDARIVPVLGGESALLRYPEVSGADYLAARLKASIVV